MASQAGGSGETRSDDYGYEPCSLPTNGQILRYMLINLAESKKDVRIVSHEVVTRCRKFWVFHKIPTAPLEELHCRAEDLLTEWKTTVPSNLDSELGMDYFAKKLHDVFDMSDRPSTRFIENHRGNSARKYLAFF